MMNYKQNDRQSCPESKEPDCPVLVLFSFARKDEKRNSHTFLGCEASLGLGSLPVS